MGYNFYDFGILFIWYKIDYLEFLIKEKFLFLLKLKKNFDFDIWYLYLKKKYVSWSFVFNRFNVDKYGLLYFYLINKDICIFLVFFVNIVWIIGIIKMVKK